MLVVQFDANCFGLFKKTNSIFVLSNTKEKDKKKNVKKQAKKFFFTSLLLAM